MGILTDSKSRIKCTDFLLQHYLRLIWLCYIVGLALFSLLSTEIFNNKTYFSENALLPSLVVREFNSGTALTRLLEKLKDEANLYPSTLPFSWIENQFRQLGLDVYEHNFTLNYPFGVGTIIRGKNIYAILRAPKMSSTEALVLSTPYRGPNSIHDSTYASIALMMELAKTFRKHAYWSKDIIFLITQHEMIGYQAWLDAYHKVSTSKYIDSGVLKGSSGLIQGVINLEINGDANSYINIKIEGLNGQLPNLDLFNLAVELCNREAVTTAFHSKFNFHPTSPVTWESWKHNIHTMISMMGIQSTGLPTGGHGLFHRYGIQALTLESSSFSNGGRRSFTLTQMGRVLEGMFRSLNNLLEKFHQSFFFYLLSGTRSYASIGVYMPPFALVAAPILIKALCLYLSITFRYVLNIKTNAEEQKITRNEDSVSLWSSLDIIVVNHLFGVLMYSSSLFVNDFQEYTKFSVEDSLYFIHVMLLCIWFLYIFCFNYKLKLSSDQYAAKMCIVLLELGAFIYTLSLINISLAMAIAIIFVPISISLQYRGKLSFFLSQYLFVINPFVITYVMNILQSYFIDPNAAVMDHVARAFTGHKKILLYTIEDLYFFGNWNYQIITFLLLPIWFELWTLRTIDREGK